MNTAEMIKATTVRDLGIQMKHDLTFAEHITKICKKAYRNLGFVLRQTKDIYSILAVKSLYNALVRSQLESCSMIWNPHETKYVLMTEKIQNKFLRCMYKKQYGIYPSYPIIYPTKFLLGMIGYYSIEVRRKLSLSMYVFKVFRGQLDNSLILGAIGICVPNTRLRRGPRLEVLASPTCRTNILKFAPVTVAIRLLNDISRGDTDLFHCTLTGFTQAMLKHLTE